MDDLGAKRLHDHPRSAETPKPWGLLLLLIAIAAVWTQQRAVLLLVISPHWATPFPPPSLIVLVYCSGVILLFGGVRLYRAALFPVLLLWCVNPVPHVFSLWVDLPLQTLSAHIARSFAMHLGQPLTPDHLRLMFTPEFGMFIAPGCNGIRGAITMGYISLIAGFFYKFRWHTTALVVAGSILLGYIFNLARLCLLVLYYLVALHFTSLQDKAENADYVIGAVLFLIATFLLFTVIQYLRDARSLAGAELAIISKLSAVEAPARMRYSALTAVSAIAFFGLTAMVRARPDVRPSNATIAATAAQQFPSRISSYTLMRSWNETLVTGPIVYVWAQYAPTGGGGNPIAVGLSPLLGWHDPLLCHATRGEHPLWQGPLTIQTADVTPTGFSSAFYTDGVVQSLEVSTQCSGASCGEVATERTYFGFVYSRPNPKSLLSPDVRPSIPILIRAETTDMSLSGDQARTQLTQDVRAFLVSLKLTDLTRPFNP